ncbi:MAG: phosphoglucomutase/phosphomannomutase family protein [Lachnospiraceae bacterium]|nr:phosphoglucomutase/phosphomannomutase family protein [Lachnospiraceae bacterium]
MACGKKIKFGTGGWRAIIGDDFTRANISLLAKAMADKMKAEGVADKGVVIGYDRRFLSKETVIWSCEVLAAEGVRCHFVNRSVPTPLIMYYVMKYEFPYGLMVTASHNPALYNGIKVFTAGGRDADETQTREIEGYIDRVKPQEIRRMDYREAVRCGLVREFYPMNEYVDNIIDKIDLAAIKEARLRVALDPMHGVSETALGTILITGRCDVSVIHQEHDTLFGGKMPAPAADRLGQLQTFVVDKHYDLGIATDGDADRLGVIDDQGRYLHPNDILVLLYYYLLKYKGWRGPVVRNLATTHRLDTIAAAYGQKCYEVPVGFKHISAKMMETGAILGGESSGGLTVAGHINGKDGVYAAALLVEMVAKTGKNLSELMADVDKECGACHMEENSYSLKEDVKLSLQHRLFVEKELPSLAPYTVDRVSYMDGCKIYFACGGWLIARFSGTEPLLRLFCEMPTREEALNVCRQFLQYFQI